MASRWMGGWMKHMKMYGCMDVWTSGRVYTCCHVTYPSTLCVPEKLVNIVKKDAHCRHPSVDCSYLVTSLRHPTPGGTRWVDQKTAKATKTTSRIPFYTTRPRDTALFLSS